MTWEWAAFAAVAGVAYVFREGIKLVVVLSFCFIVCCAVVCGEFVAGRGNGHR